MVSSVKCGGWMCLVGLSIALSGCAEAGDEAIDPAGGEIRPVDDEDRRPPGDAGSDSPDAGSNNATGDSDAGADSGSDVDPDAGDGCAATACVVGATRCEGALLNACVDDATRPGCGQWSTAAACPSEQQSCIEGRCELPSGCVDNDGDAYGPACQAGPDCDDADAQVYPGASELCDGIDNDCDSEIDEGFGVGVSCTTGTGDCQATGTTVCDASGAVSCQAAPPQGLAEWCDGQDNDCDNLIDEDGVCDFCADDPYEPNDTLATATTPPLNQPEYAYSCPGDADFLSLPIVGGNSYRIYVTAPRGLADLDVLFYENGSVVNTSASTTSDMDGFTLTPPAGSTSSYAVEIVNNDGVGTFYRVAFVDTWACDAEDGFTPNHTRELAAYLPPGWRTGAVVCSEMSDWFAVGTLAAGSTITASTYDVSTLAGDLDLYLWGDADGDGIWDVVAASRDVASSERLVFPITATGPYFLEVYDFAGYGDRYQIEYTVQ